MNESWRNFLGATFKTPRRALIAIVFIVAIILSGIIRVLASAFIANVFEPLLLLAFLGALILFVAKGGKR